jgi:hypothetical protein
MDGKDNARAEPLWVTTCWGKGVNSQWLDYLQQSFVCNFTPEFRARTYVNAYLSTRAKQFATFNFANVPLIIRFGHDPHVLHDQAYMKSYLPRKDEVDTTISMYHAPPFPWPVASEPYVDYGGNQHESHLTSIYEMPLHDEGLPPAHQQDEALEMFLDELRWEEADYAAEEDDEDATTRMAAQKQAEVD